MRPGPPLGPLAGAAVAEAAAGVIAFAGTAAAATVEHCELAAEFLQHHFGGVFFRAGPVGPLRVCFRSQGWRDPHATTGR